jgi:hypothetical protein
MGVAVLGKGTTIPCGLRLALAHLSGSEISKIRWDGAPNCDQGLPASGFTYDTQIPANRFFRFLEEIAGRFSRIAGIHPDKEQSITRARIHQAMPERAGGKFRSQAPRELCARSCALA